MSLFENGIDSFSSEMESIMKGLKGVVVNPKTEQSNKSRNSQEKTNTSIPLSRDEMNAFIGLCSLEGTTTVDKMAELIKIYLKEKRSQMKK